MSKAYDDYILEHRTAVREAFEWLEENIPQVTAGCEEAGWRIGYEHDQSKLSAEEYDAYDRYFYGGNKSHKVVEDFNYAWLHHIHNNPHHWQYWVLLEDDPTGSERFKALPMPYDYIVEMICDWWSFSVRSGNLREIFDWYEAHKDKVIFHQDTRKQVERILGLIEKKLDEMGETIVDIEDDDYISHYGILGMHWGIRRFQPYSVHPRKGGESGKFVGDKNDDTDTSDISKKKSYVNDLSNELDTKWDYGVLQNGKHILDTSNFNFEKDYRTTPLETLEKEKCGTCWDFVNYQHHKLDKAGIPNESYMLVMDLSSPEEPNRTVTHTFTTCDIDGKKYWLESAMWNKRGVHEINDFKQVAKEVKSTYTDDDRPYSVFKYNPDGMDKGLTDKEYFNKATEDLVYDHKKKG